MSDTPDHDVDMATTSVNAVPTASNEVTSVAPSLIDVAQDAPSSNITSSKEPPPEKPSDIRRRSLVILSFWMIVLCLGVPIWWNTTTIPRASLPMDEMMDWADGKVFISCHMIL